MQETEELGVSILQDLHSQRQSLLHAHSAIIIYQGFPDSIFLFNYNLYNKQVVF
jgi:hypothetical protein